MSGRKLHWDAIYRNKSSHDLTWYQPHLNLSLELIQAIRIGKDAPILDVGGGDSTLVDDLLDRGYSDLTILDVSPLALERSRTRLAGHVGHLTWIEGDITQVDLPADAYQLWHDRAVFHFLTDEVERGLYILVARRSLQPGGYLIIATFGLDGPEKCSGLPVVRYQPETLSKQLGSHFKLLQSCTEIHHTPWGGEQSFQYSLFQKI